MLSTSEDVRPSVFLSHMVRDRLEKCVLNAFALLSKAQMLCPIPHHRKGLYNPHMTWEEGCLYIKI